MIVEGRLQRVPEQVADELAARVEDAAGLAVALLRLVEEVASGELGLLADPGRAVDLALLVVEQVFGRAGEFHREQRLVDRAQVSDLQAGVVESGRVGAVGVVGDGVQRGRQFVVGDRGLFEQLAAGETVGGEQLAVVSGHAGVVVAGADHADQRAQAVPVLRRLAAAG